MLTITLRTDKPEAELALYDGNTRLVAEKWQAHRQLAETIHRKIDNLLESQSKTWHDLEGVVVYRGPGSFTGLRIGLTVANTLANSLGIAVVGTTGDDWQTDGLQALQSGDGSTLALPEYGADVHITIQKK